MSGILFFLSCSISTLATRKLTDSLANSSGSSFTSDDDPELIANALPFTIKLYESLIEKDSTNAALYLATSRLLCLYSQYFVAAPLDTISDPIQKKTIGKRAKKLFLRSREYALKSIDIKKPGIKIALLRGSVDSTLKTVSAEDTTALFWISVAWFGAIGADKTDFSLAMGIKKPLTIIKKVIDINPSFYQGMAHELLGIVSVNIPKSLGGSLDSAALYFQKAIQLSDSSRASAFVLYATSVALKEKNKSLYVSLLERASVIPVESYPQLRLQNILYQQKAQTLLKNMSAVFPESGSEESPTDSED
jgi:predicted anti-sigma-YlaC factor YlaD